MEARSGLPGSSLPESLRQIAPKTLDESTAFSKPHRKIYCRYGRGCTHITDPSHNDRFWHPAAPRLNDDLKRAHYICNECGFSSQSLHELQTHLQRKTAWSNMSLVGCRISCLVDCKEWHEAYVAQFHRSGKHLVQFRISGESKWLNMTKVVFYIVERPCSSSRGNGSEYKDSEVVIEDYLAPVEEEWVYVEDISLDFAFAQSVLFKVYGGVIQETGHKTRGHVCLTEEDREHLNQTKGSFLYGELLPRGANKAFMPNRLDACKATSLFDLGMGTGKIAIQAFLQFRNLQYVFGIELSSGRYCLAEEAVLRMVDLLGHETLHVQNLPGRYIVVTEVVDGANSDSKGRVLHLECGDLFEVNNIDIADIVMMETDIPIHLQPKLCQMLSKMHEGSRTLSYLDLRRLWSPGVCPFIQLENNKNVSDRFPTSWSVQRGHHFFLWTKMGPGGAAVALDVRSETEAIRSEPEEDTRRGNRLAKQGEGDFVPPTSRCLPWFCGLRDFDLQSKRERAKALNDPIAEKIIPLDGYELAGTCESPVSVFDTREAIESENVKVNNATSSASTHRRVNFDRHHYRISANIACTIS